MLKLINALEMQPANVIEYKNSYKKGEINSEIITLIDKDYQEYIFLIEHIMLYYLVNDINPDYILGDISIKNIPGIDYYSDRSSGHIGYSIRPSERRKGYGNNMLNLALKECANARMEEVSISCLQSNTASEKIILNNGGVFDCEWIDEVTKEKANKYWIKLDQEKVKTKLYKD